MGLESNVARARDIMVEFADQTGLSSTKNLPRRYLWTDAHALCNFLSLYRCTGDEQYKHLAVTLIDKVHDSLGKHRSDDPRCGWISGLSDEEGKEHPTAGGLRIGKKLNERGHDDAFDQRLEWDRDGQYFHYLSKWMHALARASAVTGEAGYCRWATELAKVAHASFTVSGPGGQKRLLWKMSIDLSRPLVPSSGLHDPLDAYVTYNELSECARGIAGEHKTHGLEVEIAETTAMIEGQRWHTDDPLGLGGLLFDAGRVFQLIAAKQLTNPDLGNILVRTASESLASFDSHALQHQPAEYRLAFRELGLSIGLHAVARMQAVARSNPDLFGQGLQQGLENLRQYVPLAAIIEKFWAAPGNQEVATWLDHFDINRVMLATSLLPDEFLTV